MTPVQLEAALAAIVGHTLLRSVMIWGPPGVGKSSIVARVAQRHQLEVRDAPRGR